LKDGRDMLKNGIRPRLDDILTRTVIAHDFAAHKNIARRQQN